MKDFSRSGIESVRAFANARGDGASSSRSARAAALARTVLTEPELGDLALPARSRGGRWFSDKLGPAKRWLARQVGRPWSAVAGELLLRFDPRTTAGRHIVYEHLLPSVDLDGSRRDAELVVDRRGILRRASRRRFRVARFTRGVERPEAVVEWLAGRRVGPREGGYSWYAPTRAGLFRPERALDEDEVARWLALPAWFRRQHDVFAAPAGEAE